jgi:hypothetical protein
MIPGAISIDVGPGGANATDANTLATIIASELDFITEAPGQITNFVNPKTASSFTANITVTEFSPGSNSTKSRCSRCHSTIIDRLHYII